jgi:hypothetical protein
MTDKNVNAKVPIIILATAGKAEYSAAERRRIREAVKNRLLLPSKEPYHKVLVAVKHRHDGAPRFLLAFLLRSDTYTAEIARIDVDAEYRVRSITLLGGDEGREADIVFPEAHAASSWAARRVDMVFGTPVPEIKTAKAAVEFAYKLAHRLGYKVVKLVGKSASVANYRKYLSGHLRAFGHVGHGSAGGIALSNGFLWWNWFDGLTNIPLSPAVVYFNSCETLNPPLQPAVMKAGARTFIGAKDDMLTIGPSEDVFKCFWTTVLKEKRPMRRSLKDCEKAHFPVIGEHGLSGDSGKF